MDEGLVEKKRGRGMFVNEGARDRVAESRARALHRQGVAGQVLATIERLGLDTEELLNASKQYDRRSDE